MELLALLVLAGFLAGLVAFPVYVLVRLATLGREVGELRQRLEQAGLRPAGAGPSTAFAAIPVAPRWAAPLLRAREERVAAGRPPRAARSRAPIPDLETLLGANWLSKLGIAAIAVAAGLFLTYAFQSGWIRPPVRVAMGLVAAAGLFGAGRYLLRRPPYRSYAQTLLSGGVVVYFVAIYAAYNFYHLVGYVPALAALALVALAASAIAVADETPWVAAICMLGAFAAPALVREAAGGIGAGSLLRLYVYLAALDLWVLGLLRARPWHFLAALALGATWALFMGAGLPGRGDWLAEGFATFFLLFACLAAVQSLYRPAGEAAGEAVATGLVLGGVLAFVVISGHILAGTGAPGLPGLAFAGVTVALLLAGMALALPPASQGDRIARRAWALMAAAVLVVLVAWATASAPHVPPGRAPMALGFALFDYLLFLAAVLAMARRPGGEEPAVALAAASAFAHMLMASDALAATTIWGMPAVPLWFPVAAWLALGAAWLAARGPQARRLMPGALALTAQALLLFGWSIAALRADPWPAVLGAATLASGFVLLSASWIAARRALARVPWRVDLLGAFGNAVAFFGLAATAAGTTRVAGVSVLAACALGMAAWHAWVGGFALRRADDDPLRRLTYLGLSITFLTIAVPLQLHASWITLAWSVEAAVLVWTSTRLRQPRVRDAGLALLALAALKTLAWDLGSQPEPFRFVANPRMLGGISVALAAGACAFFLRRDDAESRKDTLVAALVVVANGFALLFASMDLWDLVGGMWPAAGRESAQQLGLSLFWTGYALAAVVVGIWRGARPARLFGIGLLYLAVAKVFLFDLSWLEQPYRIVSFLVLGIILLLVSLLYTRLEGRREGGGRPRPLSGGRLSRAT